MKKSVLAAAMTLAMAAPLAAADINAMSHADRKAFGEQVRAYLLENPEVIVEAIRVLEQRQADAQGNNDATLLQVNANDVYGDTHSFVGGNPDGDIVIVEFLDYNCGFCKRAHPEVTELINSDGNIRFIVKEFPILGEQSVLASRFAISVLQNVGDDAYARVHDELMTFRGQFSDASLRQLAVSLDMDADTVMDAMNSPEVDAVISANHALAQRLQINGTPSFIMGDQMLRGYVPLDGMNQIVADLRAQQG